MNTVYGPYESERDTDTAPLLREVAATTPTPGYTREINRQYLRAACEDAGVDLGAFDERIVTWLSSTFEPATVQAVIGMISRAHEAGRRAAEGGEPR